MAGRPRSDRIDAAVRAAVTDVLLERGYAAATVDAVAGRAGVPKSSLYRRWPSKAAMVFENVVHDRELVPPPDQGSFAADLLAISTAIVASLDRPAARRAIPGLLAEAFAQSTDPLRDVLVDAERGFVRTVVRRAAGRSELPAGTDAEGLVRTLHAQLLGTALAWTTVLTDAVPHDLAERLARAALATALATEEDSCSTS